VGHHAARGYRPLPLTRHLTSQGETHRTGGTRSAGRREHLSACQEKDSTRLACCTGRFVCRFVDRADSGSFIGFLVYLDNAGYHKSAAVKKYLDDRGDVVLRHLPPSTPELNPVEIQWRMIRKGTGNRLYGNTEEMKESIRVMLDNGEFRPVKISNYLT